MYSFNGNITLNNTEKLTAVYASKIGENISRWPNNKLQALQ